MLTSLVPLYSPRTAMSDEKLDKTEARHQITVPPHSAKPYFGETPIGQLERTHGAEAAEAAAHRQQQEAARAASAAGSDPASSDLRLPLAAGGAGEGVPDLRNRRNAEKVREPFPLNPDTAPTTTAALVPGDHDVNISRTATGVRGRDAPALVPRHGSLAEQRHKEFDEHAAAAAAAGAATGRTAARANESSSSSSSDDDNAVPPERVSEAAEAAFADDPALHSNDAVKKARAQALGQKSQQRNQQNQQQQRRE